MSEPFIAEIRMFGGNFAPRGWAFCEGQLLAIDRNTALFSLLGTTYGGDGRTTFGLPDLRGRVPIQPGSGPGLTDYQLGQRGGNEQDTLGSSDASFGLKLNQGVGDTNDPVLAKSLATQAGGFKLLSTKDGITSNSVTAGDSSGSGKNSVSAIQPYLALNFIICLEGLFPSRS